MLGLKAASLVANTRMEGWGGLATAEKKDDDHNKSTKLP